MTIIVDTKKSHSSIEITFAIQFVWIYGAKFLTELGLRAIIGQIILNSVIIAYIRVVSAKAAYSILISNKNLAETMLETKYYQ